MMIAYALYHLDVTMVLAEQTRPLLAVLAHREGDDRAEQRLTAARAALAPLGDLAELRWVEGVHDLPVQRPDAVAAAIEAMTARVAGAGPGGGSGRQAGRHRPP